MTVRPPAAFRPSAGFSLIELLIALAIGAMLTTALVRVTQAAAASHHLQQTLGQMQEDARFAVATLESAIGPAGFVPDPWQTESTAVTAGSVDGHSARSDRLVLRRWSDRNCHDNENPVRDATGRPRFHLLETGFHVNANGNLVQSCHYGPDAGSLVRQINNLGLIENSEAFQVRYAEDSDADGNADRWVRAGQWQEESRLLGVRFTLLLASPDPLIESKAKTLQVEEQLIPTPADGRVRRAFTHAAAFNGRLQ